MSSDLTSADNTADQPPDPNVIRQDRLRQGPARRWWQARWMVEQGMHISRQRDDEPTIEAVQFARLHARNERDGRGPRAEDEMPIVAAAHGIHLAGGRRRLEIEARLLARQTDEEIAHATGLAPAVVATYEELFFAVRDRLDATHYILCKAIGHSPEPQEGGPSIGVLMKRSAYFHGPAVLDPWLRYLDRLSDPSPRPLDRRRPADRAVIAIELFVAVSRLPSGPATDRKLLKAFHLLMNLSTKLPETRSASRHFSKRAARSLSKANLAALRDQTMAEVLAMLPSRGDKPGAVA